MRSMNLLSLAEITLLFMLVFSIPERLHELLLLVENKPSENLMLGRKRSPLGRNKQDRAKKLTKVIFF